jgi:hypothetical protein
MKCRLTPLIFFSGIVTALSAAPSAFHRLTVNDSESGFFTASGFHADGLAKSVMEGFELSGAFEVMKIASDRSFGRKVVGHQTPLAASAETIENSVDNFAQVGGFGGAAGGQNDVGGDEFPLLIAQVGKIGSSGDTLAHKERVQNSQKSCKTNYLA